ncbi:hypothetical protein NX794_05610 [Streptomyces sp. LP11]|uniref:Cysteinyl-tRNA synthetase n=1 Tax=Streptomyces pyxinicus TaxID=2970331 RepID=A0ABT2AYC1_9ACTN|nr:hypothetical protein [Streptomyces sp. LP11]MCS0600708.1 hypothetical protein [Streptomyces sp. LP11]
MLRILDSRTGQPADAAPSRRGLTRIEAHAPGLDPTSLRVLLTADLLVRTLELDDTPVWASLSDPEPDPGLTAAATALSIRPFESAHDGTAGLGAAQVIRVRRAERPDAPAPDAPARGPLVAVAPVHWEGAEAPFPALLADPAALRLTLLRVPRGEPVRLDATVLAEAAATLDRWRRAVAEWARQPSRPVPDEVRARLRDAREDDLDLPGVLAVLRDVAQDPGLPDGARFETYAHADRLLALDLPRDLGRFA